MAERTRAYGGGVRSLVDRALGPRSVAVGARTPDGHAKVCVQSLALRSTGAKRRRILDRWGPCQARHMSLFPHSRSHTVGDMHLPGTGTPLLWAPASWCDVIGESRVLLKTCRIWRHEMDFEDWLDDSKRSRSPTETYPFFAAGKLSGSRLGFDPCARPRTSKRTGVDLCVP